MAINFNIFSHDAPDLKDVSYRSPCFAGSFYPSDADSLKSMINEFLNNAKKNEKIDDIKAIIVPHAGYIYSGWVAAVAFKQIEGKNYDDVIIIAPSHAKYFKGACVFDGQAYMTPLGNALVDIEFVQSVSNIDKLVYYGRDGHEWYNNRQEHSLEVQLPFIQTVLPDLKIVPIVMGSQDNETVNALFKAIVGVTNNLKRKVLIVASSDLSHYYEANIAKSKDQPILRAFYRYDYFKMALNFFSNQWEACGGGPIVAAMLIGEQLGANKCEPLFYANSSQSPYIKGDPKRVVGYFAGIIYNDKREKIDLLPEFDETTKNLLLDIAKKKIEDIAYNRDSLYQLDIIPKELSNEYAVFVTIHKNGKLRGCMGQTIANNPLMLAVKEAAGLASSKDPRFPKIRPEELDSLDIEITVLSRMKRIIDINEIVPGRDGVLLRLKNHSGLFLPQVATEQNWDRKQLLQHLCLKAGLNLEDYKHPDAEIYIFQGKILK